MADRSAGTHLIVVHGPPCSGKSSVCSAVVRILRKRGRNVAAIDSQRLLDSLGGGHHDGPIGALTSADTELYMQLLLENSRACFRGGYDVVVDGQLPMTPATGAKKLLDKLTHDIPHAESHVFYLDCGVDEAVRRSVSRASAAAAGTAAPSTPASSAAPSTPASPSRPNPGNNSFSASTDVVASRHAEFRPVGYTFEVMLPESGSIMKHAATIVNKTRLGPYCNPVHLLE